MRGVKRCLLIVTMLALAACSTLRGEERYWLKPTAGTVSDDAVSLLHYGNYVRELSAVDREREVERQRQAFVRDKSDFRRLQYAFALLPAHANDRRQAQQLIEPLLDGGAHAPSLVALASLLDASFANLRRSDELEKKLEAVKDIERSLMQRDMPASRTPAKAVPAKEGRRP